MPRSLLMILSKNPYSDKEALAALNLASSIAEKSRTSIYLIEDGVLAARSEQIRSDKSGVEAKITRLISSGVELLAEDISLRLRGVNSNHLVDGIKVSNLDKLVEAIMENADRTVWF